MAADSVKVSVVVPVYNTAPYLPQCLDSLVGQSLDDIEIICVDDGSTDGSLAILQDYAQQDPRLTVVAQQNQRAGIARNNGLALARGRYVLFCDSDDYLDSDALELMFAQCERDNADICVCKEDKYREESRQRVPAPSHLEMDRIPKALPFNRESNHEHIFSFTTVMVHNKMYRRSFLVEHGLQFSSARNGEDVVFSASALWLAERITIVEKALVVYRVGRPGSLVATLSEAPAEPIIEWLEVFRRFGDAPNFAKRSFDCKVVGVIRHSFRNLQTVEASIRCFDCLRSGVLSQLEILEQECGYYYKDWYSEFVGHLRNDTYEAFLVYLVWSAVKELDWCVDSWCTQRHDALRRERMFAEQIRESECFTASLIDRAEQLEMQNAELTRKFSKVEWVYRSGRAVIAVPRLLKKLFVS